MTYENKISQTGYVTYTKEIGKMVSISLGIGVKQPNGEYKTGFLEVRGTKELFDNVQKGDKVKVKGFVSFNFWTKDDKENQKIVMVATEVEKDDGKTEPAKEEKVDEQKQKKQPKQDEVKTKKQPKQKEEELPEIDVDVDEIPF